VHKFNELLQKWKAETALYSSTREKMDTPSFVEIIGMGPKITPLIIEELRREASFIFLALHVIEKENPVPVNARGNLNRIVAAWLSWADRNRKNAA
jgi:hypothetical protein